MGITRSCAQLQHKTKVFDSSIDIFVALKRRGWRHKPVLGQKNGISIMQPKSVLLLPIVS